MDTYLIQFSATESGGTTMEFLAAFIECQNGFGCYNLIGSYPRGDKEAQAEIYAALDSFRANGPAGTIYQRFYDERIPFQFLYLEDKGEIVINVAGENQLEMSNSKIGLKIYSQYLSNAQNKETLLDAIANEMTHTSSVELRGARRESKSGGIDWVVDGYTITEEEQIAYMDVYGGEFDDYVFLILVVAEAEDDLLDGLLLDVTNTIRPVK